MTPMTDYISEILDYRRRKDEYFRSSNSPLKPDARAAFTGLPYYAPDPAFRVTVPVEAGNGDAVELTTTTGETRTYTHYATAEFEVPTGRGTLVLYAPLGEEHPAQLFVPFRDATSGRETYGAGRYLEAHLHHDIVTLDFNLAYHPYCAYAPEWSCPLPPSANWLDIAVPAGERNAN